MRIYSNPGKYKGISLIELIIFIVIISVALTGITLIYINTTRYSADPMVRIRSIELAQATMEEILFKAYDENTPVGGGCVRYPVGGNTRCTPPAFAPNPTAFNETVLIAEEGAGNRTLFDDVDDYNNIAYCGDGGTAHASCTNACLDLVDEAGNDISAEYSGFAVCIRVNFDGGAGSDIDFGTGVPVLANDAKRIDVIVTDPLNSQIGLSAYKLNF